MGRHHLVSCFLHGTLRLRPATQARVLAWDLAVVLERLSLVPFKLIVSISKKFLILKMAFLLTITSLKRVGDLMAL